MSATKHHSLFSDFDVELFKSGKHYKLYDKLGAHPLTLDGEKGVHFAVWAPSANRVSVIGDFNNWDDQAHRLHVRWDSSGIWEGFIPKVTKGQNYKYKIHSNHQNIVTTKADPFATYGELRPQTASVVWQLDYDWTDTDWMSYRKEKNSLDRPCSVYEVHLGSWRRKLEENNRWLTYREMADELVSYVSEMAFTHVEIMPVMEFPFDLSWGYQITGYYAPTARFGSPEDFMYLVDKFHQADIAVILDWVPSHFPEDQHGLALFDGTHLYEHPDHRKGYHPDWKSLIFNYGRNEVRAFLISNALFWLERYHIDGLRVDAVASILYLDYSREEGEWEPNIYGGRENLDAVSFLKELNQAVYKHFDGVQTIAEESTSFPMVSKPVDIGGLGFGMKWMMGWMHDTLDYFKKEPIHRQYHQGTISFSMVYAFTENFMLPLSHDEVTHGKRSLLSNMPGDQWQQFANLRLLYSYMYMHPGSKLLFMGSEIGTYDEWNCESGLQWHLLEYPIHRGLQKCVKAINEIYRGEPALYEKQFSQGGFEWIIHDDSLNSVLAFIRKGHDEPNDLVIAANFTPVVRENYNLGVLRAGRLKEIFCSDDTSFGGGGLRCDTPIKTKAKPWNDKPHMISVRLAPLALSVYKYENI